MGSNAAEQCVMSCGSYSPFSQVEQAPPDPILGLTEMFLKDQNPKKVNLGVGVYQDSTGKVPVLASVREAEKRAAAKEITKSYLPIDGLKEYIREVQQLLFGADSEIIKSGRVVTLQSVAGSGALRVGFDFVRKFLGGAELWQSAPSWENHRALAEGAGLTVKEYRYYDPSTHAADFEGMKSSLRSAKPGTVILLHVCCHNPTGVDLTPSNWKSLVELFREQQLIPFLDMAYQGFAEDLHGDALPLRLFAEAGIPSIVASSFSKNMGLYRERLGALSILTANSAEAGRVLSQLKRIVRTLYSSPPAHGALVAAEILSTAELRIQWEQELGEMRDRILAMRKRFVEGLRARGLEFPFVATQRGMFSYSGLSEAVVDRLREERGIYMVRTGRICVAALNDSNLDYVVDSIASYAK